MPLYISPSKLQKLKLEEYVGVLLQWKLTLNPRGHEYQKAGVRVSKGMLAFIDGSIEYKRQEVMLQLYQMLTGQPMEYVVNF